MKKLILFSIILVGAVIFCGCDKDDEKVVTLSIDSAATQPIDAKGGTATFTVKSNSAWEITGAESWATVSPTKGSGDKEITVTATENTSQAARTAVITVEAGDKTEEVTITQSKGDDPQNPVTLSIDLSSTKPINADGGTTVFTVQSNSSWEITKTDEWVMVNPESGTGDKEITVTAVKNTTDSDRTAVLTVTAGDKTEEVTVTQLKKEEPVVTPTLKIENTPGAVAAAGETVYFNIESNSDWTITKDADDTWLSISPISGNGNVRVSVEVSQNETEDDRFAQLTVRVGESLTQTVTIWQLAAEVIDGTLFELDYRKHTFPQFEAAFEQLTIIDKDGDGHNWGTYEQKTFEGVPTGKFGFLSESFKMMVGVLNPENYLVLDALQLGEAGKIEVLAYSTDKFDYKEKFKIVISSEPITVDNCQDAEVLLVETLTKGDFNELEYSVDIPESYNGGPIYVGICHYECANQYNLVISKILVTHYN